MYFDLDLPDVPVQDRRGYPEAPRGGPLAAVVVDGMDDLQLPGCEVDPVHLQRNLRFQLHIEDIAAGMDKGDRRAKGTFLSRTTIRFAA